MSTPDTERVARAEQPEASLPLPNVLAYATGAFAVAATAILPFAVVASDLSLREAAQGFYLNTAVLFAVLGVLILWRQPGHVIGWVLVAEGGLDAITHLSNEYELLNLEDVSGMPSYATVETMLGWFWVPTVAVITIALPQLLPTGRLLSPRWRPLAWFGVAATALLSALFLIDRNAETGPTWLVAAAFALFGLAMLSSLVPLVVRFQRSLGVERHQLKWIFYGLAVSVPLIAIGTVGTLIWSESAVLSLPPLLILPGVITIAILRYRLYDIDVVISRTLLVAGLAAFITAAYVGIVVGIGSLVGRGDKPNLALSVAATAIVAVAFQPARLSLQRVANQLVFGRRATPYDVLSGFATKVGAAESSPETLVQLAELLAGGTGADPARVWLRVGSQLRAAATWPPARRDTGSEAVDINVDIDGDADIELFALTQADLAVPVRERGELLGVLTIAKPRGERIADVDVDLVERLAAASGVVLRNLRLDAELTQRLADLEASRRRLLSAQDDARRSIEGELAGGSRAQLLILRDRLSSLAREINPEATPKTAVLLGQLVAGTDGALDTLAGLAAGVYPPRLAADGLAVALSEQTAKAVVPVKLQTEATGRYAAEVEVAVYFAVLEALQNVAKYAAATSAQVRLRDEGNRLTFEVIDDGIGFDPGSTTLGTGLQGMADRLDTVGGTMNIDSSPGRGTTISGQVPAAPSNISRTTSADAALAGAAG